ncbi:MAG: PAS domain-containing sensor histidine kinase [Chloroflexota bacterium]|nr:PAS domain S-box protein [Chloroflexota bacterium]
MHYNRMTRGLVLPVNPGDEYKSDNRSQSEIVEKRTLSLGFLEYLAEGVLVLDHERIIRAVNSALERMLGWSASELIGLHCTDLFGCQHPHSRTSLCDNLCPLLRFWSNDGQKRPIFYQEVSYATKSGERREMSASYAPLELPILSPNPPSSLSNEGEEVFLPETTTFEVSPSYSIIVLRDITEQKRQERIKAEFVATASHQLRTPLSSIKTSIGLLLSSVGEDFNPPLLRLLHNIRSSSLRMERLVNDLIELTNLQSGRVQMQCRPMEVRRLVEKAVELNRERMETKQQHLVLNLPDESFYVEADYFRISQVLGHLLSNASKFSSLGKIIELQVAVGQDNNPSSNQHREVVFSVRDEGIGIATEEQSLIFEKFYQSQVTENVSEQGGGLGLPLAKALIELNNGHLWLESDLGRGSTFYFSLPAALPPTF